MSSPLEALLTESTNIKELTSNVQSENTMLHGTINHQQGRPLLGYTIGLLATLTGPETMRVNVLLEND